MITYWPNKQSIKLNLAVANLFVQTYQKFSQPLINTTSQSLPSDILDRNYKKLLFIEILIELEILILDLTEINLETYHIKQLNNKILYDLMHKITHNFTQKLNSNSDLNFLYFQSEYNQAFFNEHSNLIHKLLIYLIFGSSSIDNNMFTFYNLKTPFNHVRLLFENTIIQISNIIILNLLENCHSIQSLAAFLINNNISNSKYNSFRAISNFRNNLISYQWLHLYIYYPNNLYCSCYQIWLLSKKGIIYKHIYLNRISEYLKLSKNQLLSILYLEVQDFIIPKLNNIIMLFGQMIIYILGQIINQGLKICSKTIINKVNENKS